ncbi:uroporphyrinogen decarboxylase family protein [Thermatribacter velox]|uniref:Uroporphyrinogen decarboxylase family protein n=1 Tax=Thermatribacter velox TaxID=3039681 RepID=A0ABZ2YEL7_9BACT
MTPRERVVKALSHQETDKLPLDINPILNTGIHVSTLHKLKVALGLISEKEPVKVVDPYQMLGEIDNELRKALGIDTVPLMPYKNFFGFENTDWKPWTFFDGTPLLVPGKFNTTPDANGNIYQYPLGDTRFPPSAKMPKDGFYHDAIIRQKPFRDEDLKVEDQIEEYTLLTDEELSYYEQESKRLYEETDYAVVFGGVPGTNLGDVAYVPGPALPDPKGIRDVEEWYVSLVIRKDFVREVFARMTEIGLENLRLLYQAVGDRIQVIMISGTDFGSQNGLFISREAYRELFKPFHKKINDWVHQNTSWKTFIHTCGGVYELLPDLREAGFDALNPVQISAAGMDPEKLKKDFGAYFTFWGGSIDTQKTLPFGSPEEVKEEVRQLISIFRPGGGFVCAPVHNIQANVPVENVLAFFEAVNQYR